MNKKTVQDVHKLNDLVHENSEQYFHTRPMAVSHSSIILPNKTKHAFDIIYGLKDLFTIGAITHSSVLMTGGTDIGKTTLAKMVLNGLFGKEEKGWHRIDVDSDFGKDSYTDVDFSKITEGKKLSDKMYKVMPYLLLPGLMADEINRAHAALSNKMLHIFDKDISLPDGSRAKIGIPLGINGKTYQFQIAAINEGNSYVGTFEIDRALRRRTVIEIPMDAFSITPYDRLCIQKKGSKEIEFKNEKNQQEKILEIYKESEKGLKLHPFAEMFVAYMGSFDYCKNSLSGEKGAVGSRNGSIEHICSAPLQIGKDTVQGGGVGCEFMRSFENNLCPYVRGVTPGITKNLISVAKGFALLRATKFVEMVAGFANGKNKKQLSYSIKNPTKLEQSLREYTGTKANGDGLAKAAIDKYVKELEVKIEDIESAIGFVGYSKIGISEPWIVKYYQGNRYEAISNFSREAKKKFEEGINQPILDSLNEIVAGKGSGEEIDKIKQYCKTENPWLWRVLSPYIEESQRKKFDRKKISELYKE